MGGLRLVLLGTTLATFVATASAHAQSCNAQQTSECAAECDQGRAVACHVHGESVLKSAESHEQQLGRAVKVVDPDKLREAAESFRKGCSGDFTWSCYKMADIEPLRRKHWRQKGLSIDRRLCNRDAKPWACTRLGLIYKQGKLVKANPAMAAKLLQKACDAGDDNACPHLGALWMERKNKQQQGMEHLQRGCDKGLAWSCMLLGSRLRIGNGVAKNVERAELLLQAACELGNQEGCVLWGVLLHQEQVGGGSPRAAQLFQRACDADVQSGCVNLGDLYELGEGVPQDLLKAARLFEHGCNRYVGGCVRIGRLYDDGRGVDQNAGKARQYYQLGCQNQDDNACFYLALSLRDSRGGIADPRAAAAMLREQCQQKRRALACQILADMHESGTGVAVNRVRRRKLLVRACELGRQQACSAPNDKSAANQPPDEVTLPD